MSPGRWTRMTSTSIRWTIFRRGYAPNPTRPLVGPHRPTPPPRGANVHATEIGTSQAMNTLVHFLATVTSTWTRRVPDNVIIHVIADRDAPASRHCD